MFRPREDFEADKGTPLQEKKQILKLMEGSEEISAKSIRDALQRKKIQI